MIAFSSGEPCCCSEKLDVLSQRGGPRDTYLAAHEKRQAEGMWPALPQREGCFCCHVSFGSSAICGSRCKTLVTQPSLGSGFPCAGAPRKVLILASIGDAIHVSRGEVSLCVKVLSSLCVLFGRVPSFQGAKHVYKVTAYTNT